MMNAAGNTSSENESGGISAGGDSGFATNAAGNDTASWLGGGIPLDETQLLPVVSNKEFPPLSLRPVPQGQTTSLTALADSYRLEKQTPAPPGQGDFRVQKDLNTFVPESEKMIENGLQQAKYTHAISTELNLLLENEKRILDRVMRRCNKFTELKEENKNSTEEWHSENHKRFMKYEENMEKLANYPDDLKVTLDLEGSQSQVQQKILLEIVHKTAQAANDISLQLSIEETIINDVDLSLSGLKKHSTLMLRLIAGWTRLLGTHDRLQAEMTERWGRLRQSLKELDGKADPQDRGAEMSNKHIQSIVNDYASRLRKLEEAHSELLRATRP